MRTGLGSRFRAAGRWFGGTVRYAVSPSLGAFLAFRGFVQLRKLGAFFVSLRLHFRPGVGPRQIEVNLRVVGCKLTGGLELLDRLVYLAQFQQGTAHEFMAAGGMRVPLHGTPGIF